MKPVRPARQVHSTAAGADGARASVARGSGAGCVFLLLSATNAYANGTFSGTVRADRVVPRGAPLPIVKDAAVCGKQAPNESLLIAADRGIANVVVAIKGVKPSAPPAPVANATIDQVGCRYVPHVQAVTVGTKLSLINSDAVLHNVHAVATSPTPATVFNVAMPFKGQKLPAVVRRPGLMKVRCDAGHDWMSAYVAVFDHPYFAVTDDRGRFTITDVPAGEHQVELWHEPIAPNTAPVVQTLTVRINDGKRTESEPVLKL
jgi:plastocyanin